MLEGPKNTPRFDDLLGLSLYLNSQLWFTVKGGKGKSEKEKGMWGKVLGKPVIRFQSPLSVETYGMHLTPPAQIVTTCVKGCQPGKLIRDSELRVFIGGLSHRHPLLGTYPEFQTPRRNSRVQYNHTICTNSLSTVSPSYQLIMGTLPKSKFPIAC